MLDKIKRLSYSSIKLLNENSSKWFKQYIQGIRDDQYHDYFVVWKAFHLIVENYNKTWNKDVDIGIKYIYNEAKRLDYTGEFYKENAQIEALYNNYFDGTESRATEAEMEINTRFFDVPFIAILDAVHDNYVEDYKAVSSFTNEDNEKWQEKMAEYYIQAGIYMLAYKSKFDKYPEFVRFTEVKKSIASLKYFTKDKIIEMCWVIPEEDNKLTKDALIEKYRLIAKGKNIIDVPFSDELVQYCTNLISRAIAVIVDMKESNITCPFGKDETVQTFIIKK